MEVKYKAYKERRAYRIKVAIIFVTCWVLYGIFGVWVYLHMGWLFGLILAVGLFGFMGSGSFVSNRFWVYETSETKIFVNLYRALELLGLCSEEEEPSKLYSRKAAGHIKKVLYELYKFWKPDKVQINSILYDKEFAEPLVRLRDNLKNRVLSRVIQCKEIQRISSVLRELAMVFGEVQHPITLNEIRSFNEILRTLKEISLERVTFESAFRTAMVSKPMKVLYFILLGYPIILIITFFFTQNLGINYTDFLRNNLAAIISGRAVFSGILAGVLVLKK